MSTTDNPLASDSRTALNRDELLGVAVVEVLNAAASGTPLDEAALLERYLPVRDELALFLRDHHRMRQAAAPLREIAADHAGDGGEPTLGLDATARLSATAVDRIGRYEIVGELGRGGMGVVYKAIDSALQRTVALKMVPSAHFASRDDLERFRNEAKLAAGLKHPGIVPIYEADQHEGLPYYTMACVEGTSLAALLSDGPLDPLEAARLMKKIGEAVTYAHGQGVVHRDLKPANILLAKVEAADVEAIDRYEPAIADFGLAKRLGPNEALTTTGQILGTPAYMPPEQAAGNRVETGHRADIYSLGAILYAALTGQPPFRAASPVEVILQVLENDPTPPRRLNRNVPRELEAICLKCLEKQPEHRYDSAAALVADLERFLRREPPEAGRPSPIRWLRRWGRREPVAAWHAGGLAFIFALVQGIYLAHWHNDLAYHFRISAILFVWFLACVALHLARRTQVRHWVQYVWSATDAVFLAALLSVVVAPIGLLMSGYFLLVAASGLFFRSSLVAFTTVAAILASMAVFLTRPIEAVPIHYAVLFEAALAFTGLVVGYQVWRFGVLREYYSDRGG